MRCNNCGWTNPEGLSKCQKCNQVLSLCESLESKEIVTVEENNESLGRCLKCGYPLGEGVDYCPNCGSQKLGTTKTEVVASSNVQNRKTVVLDSALLPTEEEAKVVLNVKQQYNIARENGVVGQDMKQPVGNAINKTVIDVPPTHSVKQDTRKTVVDTAEFTLNKVVSQERQKGGNVSCQYRLSCIDGDSSMDIVLLASSELVIKVNDIVLIGGLRYRVDC